jgi:glycosyltransferase involved in cell wall biosynthesis
MRVVFVNRYFYPDHSATSQMLSDLAFHLAARGWDVGVITSRQRYDDARARLAPHETVRGTRIRRIWSTRFGRGFLPGRALDYLTFYASAFFALRRERGAVVVALTDPPLLSVVAAFASPRIVNWVQDLFPEVAEALGMYVPRWVRRLRDWSLRRARMNVALGQRMAERIAGNVVVRHNWADASIEPLPRQSDPFTAGYSGNLGRAHEFETILAAMRATPEVRYRITGGGAQLERVRAVAPPNVSFEAYVPRERLAESLGAVDVHLISLLPQLEGLIVPSKLYGILAAGRPAIFVGDPEGEVARILRDNDCGLAVARGDAEALAAALRALAADPERARAMGRRGRVLYEKEFAPQIALAAWERILHEAAQ